MPCPGLACLVPVLRQIGSREMPRADTAQGSAAPGTCRTRLYIVMGKPASRYVTECSGAAGPRAGPRARPGRGAAQTVDRNFWGMARAATPAGIAEEGNQKTAEAEVKFLCSTLGARRKKRKGRRTGPHHNYSPEASGRSRSALAQFGARQYDHALGASRALPAGTRSRQILVLDAVLAVLVVDGPATTELPR